MEKNAIGDNKRPTCVEELVSDDFGRENTPFSVASIRVEVDGRVSHRQVHLGRVVRPRTEHEGTVLATRERRQSTQHSIFGNLC